MWTWNVPYEAQQRPDGCGAAALVMVYRALGLSDSQEAIWARIDPGDGGNGALTVALARDALDRGLAASIIQARNHWPLLGRCAENGVLVIVNHCLERRRGGGHFSVLTALEEREVLLHDPLNGPRRLTRDAFLELWVPNRPWKAFAGSTLLAVTTTQPPFLPPCIWCDRPRCEAVACAACHRSFAAGPMTVLGCLGYDCPWRSWARLHCPHCDAVWT